ncbi:multidrug ABC transporter ATPase permease [Lacticaseibacillus zeae DSM 20178 = KCTC 3804]|uniref:Multidrug ABC transporter ATPase permease n=1 Tax=Lacticaseibacillus zeae DSM 20178 = KCTC 3804 TaxID=1423816 RepID=A0A0R1EZR7_LACZE|nr:ABC transporter ATP-binding protein [Lacticaseibacillus zeae]KRK13347.1 multidrug ABC transporter ATPase permease [Lacticaseibacillus zeae DSM 20178 = KCTC 3804]
MNAVVWQTLKKHRAAFIILVIFTMISTSLITCNTYLEGKLLDSLVYSRNPRLFVLFFGLMLGLSILRLGISFFTSHIQILTKQKTVLELNRKIIFRLFTKNTLSILKWSPTTLSARINDDVTEIVSFFSDTVVRLCSVIVSTLTITAYVLRANAEIFTIMVVFLPVYFLIYVVFHQKIYRVSLEIKGKQNDYYSARNDFIGRYVEIKGAENLPSEVARLDQVGRNLFKTFTKSFWIHYWMSIWQIVMQLAFQTLFFVIGGLAVLRGSITIGFFAIILQYFGQLLNSVDQIFGIAIGAEAYRASLARMEQILDMADDQTGMQDVARIHRIDVDAFNIERFEEKSDAPELFYSRDLSCSFKTPGLYVISGDNGVGKSTFVRTMTGIYQPELKGNISINGIKMRQIDMRTLRKKEIGFSFQDVPSPHMTVREYLAGMTQNDPLSMVKRSPLFAKVYDSDVFNLRNIYDEKVDVLSSGELQLVRLLAAFGKENASMYILDEPTANIYPEIRAAVIGLLKELAKSKLVIAITHDDHLLHIGTPIVMQ